MIPVNFEKKGITVRKYIISGEQWDFPNGWPPLNHIAIEALLYSGSQRAQTYALKLAQKWVRSNFKAFYGEMPHTMFEKVRIRTF